MSVQIVTGRRNILKAGIGVGDVATLYTMGGRVGDWDSGDQDLLALLEEDETSILKRRGVIDLFRFERQWVQQIRLLQNGRPQRLGQAFERLLDSPSRFTAIVTCIVAVLDTFASESTVRLVLKVFLQHLFQAADINEGTIVSQLGTRINAWRSAAAVRGMHSASKRVWEALFHQHLIAAGHMPKDDANEVANFLYWVIAGSSDKLDTSSTDVAGIAYCLTHLGFEILSVENFATTLNTGTSCRLIYSVAPYLLGGDSREENRWHIALSSTRFPTPVTSTYETACTSIQQTFHTAYTQSDRSQSVLRNPSYFYKDSEHTKLLQSKNIIPSDHRLEQDWSGGGQHVEFSKQEKQVINDILIAQGFLGSSSSAIVESVKCRRILLARKTIRCGRGFSKSQAVDEVAHLNRLDHSHIVRVIGTYVVDNDLSILMFPAAEYNLNSFLEKLHDPHLLCETDWNSIVSSSATFFCCLSGAMSYIHGKLTKHMDIKPANILVRDCWGSSAPRRVRYKVYIADFGIARSYVDIEAVETDGPTLFTRKFAAPEVVDRQKRGLAADVFSLGCVFVEILAALTTPIDLTCYGQLRVVQECQLAKGDERKTILQNLLSQNENGDTSYQANIEVIQDYVSTLSVSNAEVKHYGEITGKMLSRDPTKRPTAKDVAPDRMLHQCCIKGSDPLDAAPKEQSPNEESVES